MQRRTFLKGLFGALCLRATPLGATGATPKFASCFSNQGRHWLGLIDRNGALHHRIELPSRGHGMAIDPFAQTVAVFARRPGNFVYLVDLTTGEVQDRIAAAPGRHFYGHGLFSADGDTLLASENDFEQARGVIGIYRQGARGWQREGEFGSQGIGPHQVAWLSDRRTLVVANGGIETHPDLPRVKLNIDRMRPNLAFIDSHDGRLLRQFEPPGQWHQLSIRHIDVAVDDTIAIAMQYEGSPYEQPPLIAIQQGDSGLELLRAPPDVQPLLRNYCGSVRFDRSGERFAVSSPRGGLVTLWNRQGEYLATHRQADVCGIASAQRGFVFSDGGGTLQHLGDGGTSKLNTHPQLHWDNHLVDV